MIRYCTKCNTGTDFTIKSMTDLDNLVCPNCGSKVDKNSRKPVGAVSETSQAEEIVGGFFYFLYKLRYYFYLIFAVIGICAYFMKLYKLMLVVTIVNVAVFYYKLIIYRYGLLSGLVFIPLGGLAGYLYMEGNINGICFGILIVFAIKHMIKAFFWRLFWRFMHFCGK